ncbi:hypothetical protein HK104_008845 [Borealophlyctis nickersoniae]|nr:hypothetical protein HK104_008845 [Borealophlyctis nickersoniae]
MSSANTNPTHRIDLNVGGRIFSTTRSTLLNYPDSMLAGLCRFHTSTPPSDSLSGIPTIFIDRDPDLFAVVLGYLRTNEVHLTPTVTKAAIASEAVYYGLPGIVDILNTLDRPSSTTYYACRVHPDLGWECSKVMELDKSAVDMQVFSALSCLSVTRWDQATAMLRKRNEEETGLSSGFCWHFVGFQSRGEDAHVVVLFLKRELKV